MRIKSGLRARLFKNLSLILLLILSFSCSTKEPSLLSLSIVPEWTLGEEEGEENYIFGGISGIEEDLEGNIYILDFKFWNLRKFDKNRKFVKTIAARGIGPGEISQFPVAMTLKNEKVYVILINTVIIYDTDGNYLNSFKTSIFPRYIAVDPSGNIILVNADDRITRRLFHIFDPEGKYKTSFGEVFPAANSDFKKIAENWMPSSIFISGDGKLYVADPFEYAIYVYTGTTLEKKVTRKSANFEHPQVFKDEKGNHYQIGGIRAAAEYGDYLLVFLEGEEKGRLIEVLDKESYRYLGSTEMEKKGYLNVAANGGIFIQDEDQAKITKYKLVMNQ